MSRRAARRAAVEALYAGDVRGALSTDMLVERESYDPYSVRLVEGVVARHEELDEIIARHATRWRPDRMSIVDRNILRVAVYELCEGDVPVAAVVDEAVEIAKRFSGEEAGRFVNGVLSGVLQELGGGGEAGDVPGAVSSGFEGSAGSPSDGAGSDGTGTGGGATGSSGG